MATYDAAWLTPGSLAALAGALLCSCLLLQWYKKKSDPAGLPLPPGRCFGVFSSLETILLLRALSAGNLVTFMRQRAAKLGNTFRTSLVFHPTIFVQGVAANRFIAMAEHKKQLFSSLPASASQLLGEHIPIVMQGAAHRRFRQIIVSCVAPLALKKVVAKADLLTRLHFKRCWHAPSQVALFSLIKLHAFTIACSLLAGTEDEAVVARMHHHFVAWCAGMSTVPLDLPGTTFRKAKKARQLLLQELSKIIERREEEMADEAEGKGGAGKDDILGILLRASDENGSFLTREELKDVMLFLLFAGHDTAAATLSFSLKFLEQNPACYDRLCQEHRAIALQKSPMEALNWSDIENMKYTWAVIQETLRLRPVVTGGVRDVRKETNFDGYKIPKGWKVAYSMSITHYDETFFQEATKFDPSRFHVNGLRDGHAPPPYVYVPFGIGPHTCPGGDFARMFMSLYLHHLALGQFKWQSCDSNEKMRCLPILHPANNYVANVY